MSLQIARPATIARAAEIRDQVAAAVAGADSLEIELDDEAVDVSILQILTSARRSLRQRGGALTLKHPASAPLLALLSQGGFVDEVGRHQIWDAEVKP